jgi:mitotic-spindle organizing protein 1
MKELFLGYFIDMSTVHLNEKIESSRETIEVLHSISELLGCDLDAESLVICTTLIQMGINPERLAQAVKEIQQEKALILEKSQ